MHFPASREMKAAPVVFFAILLAGICACEAVPSYATEISCAGDCNGNHSVSIDELQLLVNVALGKAGVSRCSVLSDVPTVNYLIQSVNRALTGCPARPTPTPTPFPERSITYHLLQRSALDHLSGARGDTSQSEILTGTFTVLTQPPGPNEYFGFLLTDLRFVGERGTIINGASGAVEGVTFGSSLVLMSAHVTINEDIIYLQGYGTFVQADPPLLREIQICGPESCERTLNRAAPGYVVTLSADPE